MNAFDLYLREHLDGLLRKHRVVVWYDRRGEFLPFIDNLGEDGIGRGGLPRVLIHRTFTHIARFEGSFFALRRAIEPIMEMDEPDPLLVYLPGIKWDEDGSVLKEAELAGICRTDWRLRGLARNVLRRTFTDREVDAIVAPAALSYADVTEYLARAEQGGQSSILKVIFGESRDEEMLACWLADERWDEKIEKKEAGGELFKLIGAHLGLEPESGVDLKKARHQARRFVLVGEFRSDLTCSEPANLDIIPAPPSKDHETRVRRVAELFRERHAEAYPDAADRVEAELGLATLVPDARHLGAVDTFRFEERALLGHAAALLADGRFREAMGVVEDRRRSFWVDREVARQAHWEACRTMAELGLEIQRVRPMIDRSPGDAVSWVRAYTGEDGWFRLDRLYRALETWIANMDEEPEEPCERALGLLREEYEQLLSAMARGFSAAFSKADWTIPGVLHQTLIYPEIVAQTGGRTAYFLVDAMRFEMGADLVRQLPDAQEARLRPAVAALPTITPVGMAALLPGASASFSVVDRKGRLASRIEASLLTGLHDRSKYLKARHAGICDLLLGDLLQLRSGEVKRKLGKASLIIVRSQEIDEIGEINGGLLARQLMDTVVGNIARAVRKLAALGVEHFVITADHGHQFSLKKGAEMRMDAPGGDTVEKHRRCWAGRGGGTPSGCVRVSGPDLGYDTDLDFIFPRGLAVFRSGGNLAYHHGGISLQELVIPVISLRMACSGEERAAGTGISLEGYPGVLTNRTFGMSLFLEAGLFDEGTRPIRVVLMHGGEEVGQAGMALDAAFDRTTGTVHVEPGTAVNIAMILTRDPKGPVSIIALDPETGAPLGRSGEIPVDLGI